MSHSETRASSTVGIIIKDSYHLTSLLGKGGMSSVYEAMQINLGRLVAVKVMAREMASHDEALIRFRREAEVTSRLGHPGIVNVFDFGVLEDGRPYIVMEHLKGQDLEQRLAQVRSLSLSETIRIMKQVSSALIAAHAKGIIHRDLKPANIFLHNLEGGVDFPKILDFGISKIKASTVKITHASVAMGTPFYMAPEQAMGKVDDIDHRTDQWAIACIVWELLSGKPPFVGEDVMSVLHQVVSVPPSASLSQVAGVPAGVEMMLRRALSKNQEDRYHSMDDFMAALEAAASDSAVRQPPAHMSTSRREPPSERTLTYGMRPDTKGSHLDDSIPALWTTVWSPWRLWLRRRWLPLTIVAGGVASIALLWLFARSGSAPSRDAMRTSRSAPRVQALTTPIPAPPRPEQAATLEIAAPVPTPPLGKSRARQPSTSIARQRSVRAQPSARPRPIPDPAVSPPATAPLRPAPQTAPKTITGRKNMIRDL
jgi:serine/threonine-protein kinase